MGTLRALWTVGSALVITAVVTVTVICIVAWHAWWTLIPVGAGLALAVLAQRRQQPRPGQHQARHAAPPPVVDLGGRGETPAEETARLWAEHRQEKPPG